MPDHRLLASLLYQAAASPHGIAVETTDAESAHQQLRQEKSALGDPALASLRFKQMEDGSLWIIKEGPQV